MPKAVAVCSESEEATMPQSSSAATTTPTLAQRIVPPRRAAVSANAAMRLTSRVPRRRGGKFFWSKKAGNVERKRKNLSDCASAVESKGRTTADPSTLGAVRADSFTCRSGESLAVLAGGLFSALRRVESRPNQPSFCHYYSSLINDPIEEVDAAADGGAPASDAEADLEAASLPCGEVLPPDGRDQVASWEEPKGRQFVFYLSDGMPLELAGSGSIARNVVEERRRVQLRKEEVQPTSFLAAITAANTAKKHSSAKDVAANKKTLGKSGVANMKSKRKAGKSSGSTTRKAKRSTLTKKKAIASSRAETKTTEMMSFEELKTAALLLPTERKAFEDFVIPRKAHRKISAKKVALNDFTKRNETSVEDGEAPQKSTLDCVPKTAHCLFLEAKSKKQDHQYPHEKIKEETSPLIREKIGNEWLGWKAQKEHDLEEQCTYPNSVATPGNDTPDLTLETVDQPDIGDDMKCMPHTEQNPESNLLRPINVSQYHNKTNGNCCHPHAPDMPQEDVRVLEELLLRGVGSAAATSERPAAASSAGFPAFSSGRGALVETEEEEKEDSIPSSPLIAPIRLKVMAAPRLSSGAALFDDPEFILAPVPGQEHSGALGLMGGFDAQHHFEDDADVIGSEVKTAGGTANALPWPMISPRPQPPSLTTSELFQAYEGTSSMAHHPSDEMDMGIICDLQDEDDDGSYLSKMLPLGASCTHSPKAQYLQQIDEDLNCSNKKAPSPTSIFEFPELHQCPSSPTPIAPRPELTTSATAPWSQIDVECIDIEDGDDGGGLLLPEIQLPTDSITATMTVANGLDPGLHGVGEKVPCPASSVYDFPEPCMLSTKSPNPTAPAMLVGDDDALVLTPSASAADKFGHREDVANAPAEVLRCWLRRTPTRPGLSRPLQPSSPSLQGENAVKPLPVGTWQIGPTGLLDRFSPTRPYASSAVATEETEG